MKVSQTAQKRKQTIAGEESKQTIHDKSSPHAMRPETHQSH